MSRTVAELGQLLEDYQALDAEAKRAKKEAEEMQAAADEAKKMLLDEMIASEAPAFVHGDRYISAVYKCKYTKGKGVSDETLFEALRAAGLEHIIKTVTKVEASTLSKSVAELAEQNAVDGMPVIPDALKDAVGRYEYFDLSDTKAKPGQLKAMAAMRRTNGSD